MRWKPLNEGQHFYCLAPKCGNTAAGGCSSSKGGQQRKKKQLAVMNASLKANKTPVCPRPVFTPGPVTLTDSSPVLAGFLVTRRTLFLFRHSCMSLVIPLEHYDFQWRSYRRARRCIAPGTPSSGGPQAQGALGTWPTNYKLNYWKILPPFEFK